MKVSSRLVKYWNNVQWRRIIKIDRTRSTSSCRSQRFSRLRSCRRATRPYSKWSAFCKAFLFAISFFQAPPLLHVYLTFAKCRINKLRVAISLFLILSGPVEYVKMATRIAHSEVGWRYTYLCLSYFSVWYSASIWAYPYSSTKQPSGWNAGWASWQ